MRHPTVGQSWISVALMSLVALTTSTCARSATVDASAAPRNDSLAAFVPASAPPVPRWSPTAAAIALEPLSFTTVVPNSAYLLRAVGFRPTGSPGPAGWPVIVILPGSEGLTWDYVDLARGLAERGTVAVAGCWFKETQRNPATIPCPFAPALVGANKAALPAVDALAAAALDAAGAAKSKAGPVYLVGHSRGATMALHVAASSDVGRIGGVIASSAITNFSPGFQGMFDDMPIHDAPEVKVPILLVHPQDDSLVAWTQSLAEAGALPSTLVKTWFPPTGEHDVLTTRPADFVAQSLEFIAATADSAAAGR